MDINEEKAENTPAGGVLMGKKDGQTIIHDKGTMSGYLVGKLHKDGGIKAVNKATGQPLEMQGGEVIITAPAVSDQTKREFEGKMMTNREILSTINQKGGGVSFADGGDVPEKFTPSGASYNYGGKTMTDHEIFMAMNGAGHLSKNKSLKQIAEMHKVSLTHINEQLAKGLEVEKEHFADFKERTRVAKDHLVENPNYYTILAKAGLKRGGKIEKEDLVEDAKSGNTPARDLNNYNDLLDVQADGAVGGDSGIFADGGVFKSNSQDKIVKGVEVTNYNLGGLKEIAYNPNELLDIFKKFHKKIDFIDTHFFVTPFNNSGNKFKEIGVEIGGGDFQQIIPENISEHKLLKYLKGKYGGLDWSNFTDQSSNYANGGVAPYDANLEGDSVDIVEKGFAKGGVVYDTTKPKIEKITIKDTKFNRTSVIGRNASTISEFQQIVSDYIGNTPKEDVDWINFYVNDSTRGSYYIDLNKGKKNTVKNVNPETLNSLNFKRVIDAKAYLVKNYDWTDFFELGGQKQSGKDNSVIRIAITYDSQVQVKSGGMSLAESTVELYNFLRGLHNGDYKNVKIQPIGNGLGVNPIELNLSTLSWDNILTMMPEENAVKEINKILYGLFPELNFSKFKVLEPKDNSVDVVRLEYSLSPSNSYDASFKTGEELHKRFHIIMDYIERSSLSHISVYVIAEVVDKTGKINTQKERIDIGEKFFNPNKFSYDETKKLIQEKWFNNKLDFENFFNLSSQVSKTPTSTQSQYPEYYKFVGKNSQSFTTGNIYKILNPKDIEAGQNFIDDTGIPNGFSGDNGKKFKPSTEEAYLAQQSGVSSISSIEPKSVDAVNVEYVYPNGRIEVGATINISNLKNALANFWNIVDKKSWEVRITPFENQFTPFEEKKLIIGNDFAEFNPETFSEEQLGNKLKTLYPNLDWSYFLKEKSSASKAVKPFDLTDSKIWIGDNPELSKKIQEFAFANGIYWINGVQSVVETDKSCLVFDKYGGKTVITFRYDREGFDKLNLREITEEDVFGNQQPPTSNRVVPKTIETSVYDLDSAVNKLEKASSTVATEYNKDIYDKSLKFLYDTKATYELALKFTPESAFMYERLDLMKKLADIEKNIKKIEDMKKGGTFYMLAKIIERLQRGENWRMLEQSQDVITNQIPQSEIDVIIRSQKFKNWFGDWEKALVNDEYDNVSKALTDGIPSVYHHGARRIKYTYREVSNGVLYLAENISYATWFSQNATAQTEEGNYLTECFVNIKNPIDLTAFHVNKVDLADIVRYVDAVYPMAKIYDFIPAQVALLIKTNQPTNVRMWAWQLIRSYAKFVNHIKENTPYDGFLYYENNPSDQVMNPVTGQLEENVTKAVAIFKSYQVKVVDAVLFDGGLDDWRFENGGKIKN